MWGLPAFDYFKQVEVREGMPYRFKSFIKYLTFARSISLCTPGNRGFRGWSPGLGSNVVGVPEFGVQGWNPGLGVQGWGPGLGVLEFGVSESP